MARPLAVAVALLTALATAEPAAQRVPTHPFELPGLGSFADAVVRPPPPPNATAAAEGGSAPRGHVVFLPLVFMDANGTKPHPPTQAEIQSAIDMYSCVFPSLPGSPHSQLALRDHVYQSFEKPALAGRSGYRRQDAVRVATCSFESNGSTQHGAGGMPVQIVRKGGEGGEGGEEVASIPVVTVQATDYTALFGSRRPTVVQTSMVRDSSKSDCPAEAHQRYCLRDWVEYHRLAGVEHFVLYDNLPRSGESRAVGVSPPPPPVLPTSTNTNPLHSRHSTRARLAAQPRSARSRALHKARRRNVDLVAVDSRGAPRWRREKQQVIFI